MKKIAVMVLAVVMCTMCFTSCGGYESKYYAVAFVHSNTDQRGEMSFSEFEGTYVFELKRPSADAKLAVGGKNQSGSMTVYVDHDGEKRELLCIDEPGEIEKAYQTDLENEKIYVIVESNGKCHEGAFVARFM